MKRVVIEMSRRHIHLSPADCATLFGEQSVLRIRNMLSQPGQFAATETVTARSRGRVLEHIRVVGPCRNKTQLEIAPRDAHALDIHPSRRISGDVKDAETVCIVGPKGSVEAPVILAQRHVHCDPQTAREWGITDKKKVRVAVEGAKKVINNVAVRIYENAVPAVHIDEDEAEEFGVQKKGWGIIVY